MKSKGRLIGCIDCDRLPRQLAYVYVYEYNILRYNIRRITCVLLCVCIIYIYMYGNRGEREIKKRTSVEK